jgi:protoporphyrinogen oxidase
MTRQHIGIVGGGIAGLTAALRLSQAGHQITLWERGSRFGGQAAAFPVEGNDLEYFYHHLFQSDREIAALIEEIGIGNHLLWLPSNVGYFADGKIFPLNGAKDLLKLGIIPFHDRLRLGLVTAYLQKVRDWKKYETITAERWLRRALGKRAYERTLGAQLDAKFGRYQGDVAMVWFWGKIWLRTTSRKSPLDQEKLGYIKGSFNVLIDALVAAVKAAGTEMHLDHGPSQLTEAGAGKWRVEFDSGADALELDRVIVTTPSPIMSRLVPALPDDYRAKLHGLTYEAAAVALLQLSQPLSDIYWLNIADRDMPFTGVIEHTNFMPSADYGGKHYVYLSKYMETDHPYFSMPEAELIETYIPYLKRINPAFDRSWIERWWVFRERAAQPIVTLNYSEKIPDHRTPLKNLYLANTSQIYPEDRGTNYSVRLGNHISKLVLEDIAAG